MKQHALLPAEDPLYPSSDGLPLAENDAQLRAIHNAFGVLDVRYEDRMDVYVSADLLIYYEEGNPRRSVAPGVFVVFGAAKHDRTVYKLWEEPKAPDFVLEVASKSTWAEDVGRRHALYAALGVREYWLFDPKEEYFDPSLRGLVLRRGVYRELPAPVENGARTIRSGVLGLDLCAEGGTLRFWDPVAGEFLKNHSEERKARTEATRERDEAIRAFRSAEARIAELEAHLRQ